MNARVFVGYSESDKTFGPAMADLLKEADVVAISWPSAFSFGESLYNELLGKPYQYDFGVFVFSPADFQSADARIFLAPNLMFELGLFTGVKGKKRVFAVLPENCQLPSDLQGVIHPRYNPASGLTPAEALRGASDQILAQMAKARYEDFYFIMNKMTQHCLDVKDWGMRCGNPIIPWRYHGGANQLWTVERHEAQWVRIRSKHSDLCLQVAEASQTDNAPIEQGQFAGLDHQQWALNHVGRAYFLKARHSRKALVLKKGPKRSEFQVVQRTWEEADDALWWFARPAAGFRSSATG